MTLAAPNLPSIWLPKLAPVAKVIFLTLACAANANGTALASPAPPKPLAPSTAPSGIKSKACSTETILSCKLAKRTRSKPFVIFNLPNINAFCYLSLHHKGHDL